MSTIINGIDVSKYQGTVDWDRVRTAGMEFVFVRLGWCGYDGKIAANGGLDPMFEANVTGAAAAGLGVGVYVYSYAKTVEAAGVAAAETLELIRPHTLTWPVAFDIEDSLYTGLGQATNTAITQAFLAAVAAGGYYPMLYTYKHFAEAYLNMAELAGYDLWLAQYASTATYAGDYSIWQYSGSASVEGVVGEVDRNRAYRDYAALIRQQGLNRLGARGTAASGAQTGAEAGEG